MKPISRESRREDDRWEEALGIKEYLESNRNVTTLKTDKVSQVNFLDKIIRERVGYSTYEEGGVQSMA